MAEKKEIYKGITLAGAAMFIPFVLVAGPLAGYFAGSWLKEKFSLGNELFYVCIFLGFAVSIFETLRITRFLIRVERGKNG